MASVGPGWLDGNIEIKNIPQMVLAGYFRITIIY
jgi:hypothetical protein